MGVPQTKSELLYAIEKNFGKLTDCFTAIPPEQTSDKTMEGHAKGTQMSVCNLVAYLLGWHTLVIKWITRESQGLPVDFPETGYQWNQLGLLAQKFYADYRDLDYSALLIELQSAKDEIIQLINARTDHELYDSPWYGKWTMGRMISLNTSSPYVNASGRLRKWAKNKSQLTPH
ncbi:ClbS/DfsB family four-helix bundle protein [Citrobacter amalonaticus]|uniref:ClbS/DfsB family four-helix bundle protein n=1 Tax=Citrobacter amalonaticus TaxID=35703 RepID=UPI003D6E1765